VKLSAPQQGGSVPVSSLDPGSYQLEVSVADSPERQVKRVVDFEVR